MGAKKREAQQREGCACAPPATAAMPSQPRPPLTCQRLPLLRGPPRSIERHHSAKGIAHRQPTAGAHLQARSQPRGAAHGCGWTRGRRGCSRGSTSTMQPRLWPARWKLSCRLLQTPAPLSFHRQPLALLTAGDIGCKGLVAVAVLHKQACRALRTATRGSEGACGSAVALFGSPATPCHATEARMFQGAPL